MEVSWYYWKKNFLKEISFKNFITDEKLNKIVKLSSGLDDGKFINIFPNLPIIIDHDLNIKLIAGQNVNTI